MSQAPAAFEASAGEARWLELWGRTPSAWKGAHCAPAPTTRALRAIFRNLSQVRDDDFIEALARETREQRIEDFTMSYRQRLIDQGREEGREEGRASARQVLEKLLVLEFGGIDSASARLLRAGSLEDLTRWSERVLTAETLATVFYEGE